MNKETTVKHIVERLRTAEIDYHGRSGSGRYAGEDVKQIEAGVLIPIFFRVDQFTGADKFVFLLSKRSASVPQSGDLSGLGGKLEPFVDRFLRFFIVHGFPPLLGGEALMYAREREKVVFDRIALFLANAVRESWEEARLSPFNIRFLGPLPPYPLKLFTKTIFPIMGLVEKRWKFHSSPEVDKMTAIPLETFYNTDNYNFFSIRYPDYTTDGMETERRFPCLTHTNTKGEEEILWGATFDIILSFLDIVFDFTPPEIQPDKIITRTLHPDYLTGNFKRRFKLLDKFRKDR